MPSSTLSQWMAWNLVDSFTNRFRFPFAYTRVTSTHIVHHAHQYQLLARQMFVCVSLLDEGMRNMVTAYVTDVVESAVHRITATDNDLTYIISILASIRWGKREPSMQSWVRAARHCACTPNKYDCEFSKASDSIDFRCMHRYWCVCHIIPTKQKWIQWMWWYTLRDPSCDSHNHNNRTRQQQNKMCGNVRGFSGKNGNRMKSAVDRAATWAVHNGWISNSQQFEKFHSKSMRTHDQLISTPKDILWSRQPYVQIILCNEAH